jgi:hypothetical protein
VAQIQTEAFAQHKVQVEAFDFTKMNLKFERTTARKIQNRAP